VASCSWGLNAAPQPLPEAGATQERTLEAVGCRRLILIEAPSRAHHFGMLVFAENTFEGGDLI